MNCCVWTISIILLASIGGAVGIGLFSPILLDVRQFLTRFLGWYLTHGKPADLPVAVGGSESRGVPTGTELPTKEPPPPPTTASGTSRVVIAPTLATSKRAFVQERATILPEPLQRRATDARVRRRTNRMAIEELN